jgi:hypothetical protein
MVLKYTTIYNGGLVYLLICLGIILSPHFLFVTSFAPQMQGFFPCISHPIGTPEFHIPGDSSPCYCAYHRPLSVPLGSQT